MLYNEDDGVHNDIVKIHVHALQQGRKAPQGDGIKLRSTFPSAVSTVGIISVWRAEQCARVTHTPRLSVHRTLLFR